MRGSKEGRRVRIKTESVIFAFMFMTGCRVHKVVEAPSGGGGLRTVGPEAPHRTGSSFVLEGMFYLLSYLFILSSSSSSKDLESREEQHTGPLRDELP